MKLKSEIFKAYDIRGLYPKEINTQFAYLLGRAFVKLLNSKVVVVGRDSRSSSEILFKSLSQGIIDQGADVIDIGTATSPIFNFAVAEYDLHDSGIMITASHLPSQYNGFKMVDGEAIPLEFKKRSVLKKIIEEGDFKKAKKGNLIKTDLIKDYYQKVFGLASLSFSEIEKVANKIKFEVNYDEDKDRIVFFDERGEMVGNNLIDALLIKYLLKEEKGAKIIFTANSSKIVKEQILKSGGEPVISRVGHYFVKKKMKEVKALFAGELSGHYYFRNFYYCECPDLVLLKILEIIKKEGKNLKELIEPFKKYYNTGEINFKVKDKEKKLKEIKKYYKSAKKTFLDGITCEFKDWWFNLRPSNTEELIRLVLEADTEELMKQKKYELEKLIK